MNENLLAQITGNIVEGENEAVTALTRQALASGIEPMTIINRGLMPGMEIVGQKFESGEYFLPNLIISASAMQDAMDILKPELSARKESVKSAGVVVIGTVQGDIHEIGKSLVGTMLSANGFEVHDLGVDVPVETFISKIKETGANMLGLSALLTTTMSMQQEIIQALEKEGLRSKVKVMVGGAPVTQSWANEIGADGYAEDAIGAVTVAKKLSM